MKSFRHITSTLLALFAISLQLDGQVIINEISYNPPEAGTDSLEYIELYNAGTEHIDLTGYTLTGVVDTLPTVHLSPGTYFVTAVNANAMQAVFGITVHEWKSGGLNNSGEKLVLYDAGGSAVDSVEFEDSDPWPSGADGMGPSIELIDPQSDNNDGANWQISGAGTGVILEGFEVFGTPGAQNSGGGTGGPAITILAEHLVFTPQHAVVEIGDVVRWTNPEDVPHNVNGSQSVYAGNPESIFSGAPAPGPWDFDYTTVTVGLYNYHCDVHVGQGMTGTLSVYDPNNYTDFPLDHLRRTDQNGSHIFDGVPTRVTGVVRGINFQPTGYSFYIINEQNVGINVFSFDPGSYIVQEGDEVRVSGVIDQFNGLLEIIPDEIEVLATNQNGSNPDEISVVSETNESSFIVATILSVDSIVATGTSGYNVYANTSGGTNILVRIDSDTGINPEHVAGNIVFGVGTQFDPDFPFTDGYQLLAIFITSPPGVPVLPQDAIAISPNPAKDIVQLHSAIIMEEIEVYQLDGKPIMTKSLNARNATIDIASLPSGLFIIKATTKEGIWTSKLIIED